MSSEGKEFILPDGKVAQGVVSVDSDGSVNAGATFAEQQAQTALLNPKTYTDASSTITLGGTAQAILAVNSMRTGISFMNISDADMYLNNTATATSGAGSFLIKANGGTYVTDHGAKDSQEISILCATTGKSFTCKWW